MIENQSRNEKKRKKKKKGREKEKRGERKKAILLLWLRNSRFQRRVISWSAILTSSWMRHNDENTGVLVNCCQLGNNDVVDASWRKYVARPLHFFSPSPPPPFSLFCQVTLETWTYRDFLRDNSSAIYERKPWNHFFYGTQQGDYFPILHSSCQFHCCGRPDGWAKCAWEEDFRHVSNDIYAKSWF